MVSRTARKGTSRYKIRNWKQYEGHWCTNRHIDKNIARLLFFHHFHLKIWLSWHLAQQGKVQVVIK